MHRKLVYSGFDIHRNLVHSGFDIHRKLVYSGFDIHRNLGENPLKDVDSRVFTRMLQGKN
jgi:hypothetical protein